MNWSFFTTSTRAVFHHELDSSPVFCLDPHSETQINQGVLNFNGHVIATAGKDGYTKITHIKNRKELVNLFEPSGVI